MTIRRETADGLKTVARIRRVTAGGTTRILRMGRVKADLTVETFYNDVPTLSVTISPNPASFTTTGNTTVQGSLTATITGGMAPFTYAWSVVSSTKPTAFTSPSLSTTLARQTGVVADETGTAELKVEVSDRAGQAANSTVSAEFTNVGIA